MAQLSHEPEPIGNANLEEFKLIGRGAFGNVYKAWHKDYGCDVAIKIPHFEDGNIKSVWDEGLLMNTASCEYVVRLYGIFEGCPPGVTFMKRGLVMHFMENGSVESVLKHLSCQTLWPLVCRLAHEVALGMNFLHLRKLIHHDLKPSNVLLSVNLNAKLADFGLSKVSTSVLSCNTETRKGIEGSLKYIPPEAFELSYSPVRSFDIYSYGILLWSIINGEEPYPLNPSALFSILKVDLRKGERPTCEKIDQMEREGLKELVELMKRCWDGNPLERPPFRNCLQVTEEVFSKNKKGIRVVVDQFLTTLESPTSYQSNTPLAPNVRHQPPEQSNDTVDCVPLKTAERSPKRESVRISTKSRKDKAKFVDKKKTTLIQDVTEVMAITEELGDMVSSETYSLINAAGTSQDKLRILYLRTLRSGGEVVKAALYDALKKYAPGLVERLGG